MGTLSPQVIFGGPTPLIIPGKLHLIPGPLGALTGLYEAAVDWAGHPGNHVERARRCPPGKLAPSELDSARGCGLMDLSATVRRPGPAWEFALCQPKLAPIVGPLTSKISGANTFTSDEVR